MSKKTAGYLRALYCVEDEVDVTVTTFKGNKLAIPATIKEKNGDFVRIHYDGYPSKCDEFMDLVTNENDIRHSSSATMRIVVYVPENNEYIPVNVRLTTTIKQIQKVMDEPSRGLIWKSEILDDDKTLSHYGIKNGDILRLSANVCVKTLLGRKYVIKNVTSSVTVKVLKQVISHEIGVSLERLCLIFAGKRLNNEMRVSYYNIQHNDVVHLCIRLREISVPKQQIVIQLLSGIKLQLSVDADETIADIKAMIEEETDIPTHRQELLFGNNQLRQRGCLSDYDIQSNSVLRLIPINSIFVEGVTRNIMTLKSSPNNTIKNVKRKISKRSNMPITKQRLYFKNKQLENNKTLLHYNVGHKDKIHLELVRDEDVMSDECHNQGHNSICWAYAVSTVMRAAESRIIGRKPMNHNEFVEYLIKKYGKKEADSEYVLKKECLSRQLHVKTVNNEECMIALKKDRVLLVSFHLDDIQWDNFSSFFGDENNKKQAITKEDIGPAIDTKTEGHAVAIYPYEAGEDGKNYWRIKNSWGASWCDNGYCRIEKNAIDNFKIYDVFFYQDELTQQDWINYELYTKK